MMLFFNRNNMQTMHIGMQQKRKMCAEKKLTKVDSRLIRNPVCVCVVNCKSGRDGII